MQNFHAEEDGRRNVLDFGRRPTEGRAPSLHVPRRLRPVRPRGRAFGPAPAGSKSLPDAAEHGDLAL